MLQKIINTPWHLMRWVRLIAGVFALFSFIQKFGNDDLQKMDYLILAAGIYFLYKALFNAGCEVVNNNEAHRQEETKTVDYEEIK